MIIMMKTRPVYITALLMLVILISSSFAVLMDTEGPGQGVTATPTRVAGESLEIENMTYTVSYLTGAEEWDTVWIRDNAALIIEGSTLRAKRVICRGDTFNTTFKMMGHEGTQALLSVTEGIVNINADTIDISGSRITVTNGTSTLPNGEDGGNGEISLFSKSSDLNIVDSELNVRAHNGGLGESAKFGGDGGDAYIFVGSNISKKSNILISETDIIVEGGQGGNGYVPNSGAGSGGNTELDIMGHATTILKSNLLTKGGKAGAHAEANPGEYGGNSKMNINSIYDTTIHSTEMESMVGINTNLDQPRQSFIFIKSKERKVYWDHDKPDEEKMIVVSNVTANTVNIDSNTGAELHQVNTGDDPPQPLGSGVLKLFWWARISVTDALNGDSLRDASVTYMVDPDPLPYPRDGSLLTTDDNGRLDIEVIARENQDWKKHTFKAEILGGASDTSDQYRFDQNSNEEIPILITRMTLDFVQPADFNEPQGGTFRIRGTATPGNQRNEMLNVSLYLDDELIGYAEDEAEEGAPPYNTWSLLWNSDPIPNGIYTLSVIGTDSAYQVRYDKTIKINHFVVNHPPEFFLCVISDPTGAYEVHPDGSTDIHVNQGESIISFNVEAYDRDMLSDLLQLGRKVIKSTIDIVHVPTGSVVLDDKVIGEDDIEKINLTGGYGFLFEIDANKRPGTDEPYKEGEYKVIFRLEDDGGLISEVASIGFDLYFDFYPRIVIYIDGTPAIRPGVDREFPEESFVVSTVKSHTFTAKFNFTDSSDRDDPLWSSDPTKDRSWANLKFTFEVMDPDGNREVVYGPDKKGAGFNYDFDVSNIKSGEQGIFTLMISCKDSEGLESELRLKMRVTHDPPPEDLNVFLQPWGIPFGVFSYVFLVLFVLMFVAYLVMFFLIQKKNLKDKDDKMTLLEKKKKEEDKEKGSSAIEDEFTGGRTQDASNYLKKFGGDKGKDDFAKELEAAQVKGAVQGGPIPQEKPPEVKPPEPPKAQQAPIVPQQAPPRPTPPPAQQPPAAPSVPRQQPPTQAAPRPPTPVAPPVAPPQPAAPVAPPQPQQAPPTPQPPAAPTPPKPPQPQ